MTADDSVRRIRIIGIGAGDPEYVTAQAVAAMRTVDAFVVPRKRDDDPLVAARRALLEHHGVAGTPVIEVRDPARDRETASTGSRAGYECAVGDWHEARAQVFEQAIADCTGDVGFLVWGDPAFYDSTIRIADRIATRGRLRLDIDVIPGISAVQVLAAKHRIVLHEIGGPVHVTTGRRLSLAVDEGQENILVMLDGSLACADLVAGPDAEPWSIWWGANLGTAHEALVSGALEDVIADIGRARERVRSRSGWVMDTYLLRRAEVSRPR